ncbi:uncharacterized protein LOC121832774 [Peromyscus maniculatus bairdii]|uniref:uncharacterized protein LOC121832774 n=1 Tax=Peromyscus maniculatus bairdii TaxID=230844 RepID=UPI003FD19C7C
MGVVTQNHPETIDESPRETFKWPAGQQFCKVSFLCDCLCVGFTVFCKNGCGPVLIPCDLTLAASAKTISKQPSLPWTLLPPTEGTFQALGYCASLPAVSVAGDTVSPQNHWP